jgi:hypothetical protein
LLWSPFIGEVSHIWYHINILLWSDGDGLGEGDVLTSLTMKEPIMVVSWMRGVKWIDKEWYVVVMSSSRRVVVVVVVVLVVVVVVVVLLPSSCSNEASTTTT